MESGGAEEVESGGAEEVDGGWAEEVDGGGAEEVESGEAEEGPLDGNNHLSHHSLDVASSPAVEGAEAKVGGRDFG